MDRIEGVDRQRGSETISFTARPRRTMYWEASNRFTVQQPTLVIWGETDAALEPALAPKSLEYCASGRLDRFPDVGHWLVHDRSPAVTDLPIERVSKRSRDHVARTIAAGIIRHAAEAPPWT